MKNHIFIVALLFLSTLQAIPGVFADEKKGKPAAKKPAAKKPTRSNNRNSKRRNTSNRFNSQVLAANRAAASAQRAGAQNYVKQAQSKIKSLQQSAKQYRGKLPGLKKQVDQARSRYEVAKQTRISSAREYNRLKTELGTGADTNTNPRFERVKKDLDQSRDEENDRKDELEKRSRLYLSIKAKHDKANRGIATLNQGVKDASQFIKRAEQFIQRTSQNSRNRRNNGRGNRNRNNNQNKKKKKKG